MISFALILMTLPSRVAQMRARHGESLTGRAVRTRHSWPLTGLPDPSLLPRERESAAGDNGSYSYNANGGHNPKGC
jgi:hypothetical protein